MITDASGVGECRREARRLTETFGFDATQVGQICIIATEIGANIVKHAATGQVLMQMLDNGLSVEFEILGLDQGPGMINVDQCMRDGYSTGGTSGTGLGAISRLSSTFDVFSAGGKGTVVMSRSAKRARSGGTGFASSKSRFELGVISVAVAGEIECGDAWRAAERDGALALLVADGLGHGTLAAIASRAAATKFMEDPFVPPGEAMPGLHRALSGTRGAAASCLVMRAPEMKVEYAGVGNIYSAIVTSERSRGMVSHNGTLGLQLLRAQQFNYDYPAGALMIMHSDGLSARWNLSDYPGLYQRHPAVIAGVLYRDNVRLRDDATVLVARHLQ